MNMREAQNNGMKNSTPLRLERIKNNLRLNDVCKAVNIDSGNLSRIERGRQKPSLSLAESLAKFFNHSISEIEILYPERFVSLEANNNKK